MSYDDSHVELDEKKGGNYSSGDDPEYGDSVGLSNDYMWEPTQTTPLQDTVEQSCQCLSWFCAFFTVAVINMVMAMSITVAEYLHVNTGPAPLIYVASGAVLLVGVVSTTISFIYLIKKGHCCCCCKRCCRKRGEPFPPLGTDYTAYSVDK